MQMQWEIVSFLFQVIVELLEKLLWQNVVVMYEDTTYAQSLYQELLQISYERGNCVSKAVILQRTDGKEDFKGYLRSLASPTFTAVVFLGESATAKVMLQAVDEVWLKNLMQ